MRAACLDADAFFVMCEVHVLLFAFVCVCVVYFCFFRCGCVCVRCIFAFFGMMVVRTVSHFCLDTVCALHFWLLLGCVVVMRVVHILLFVVFMCECCTFSLN